MKPEVSEFFMIIRRGATCLVAKRFAVVSKSMGKGLDR